MGVVRMGQGEHQICDLKQQCRERGTTSFFFHRFREEENFLLRVYRLSCFRVREPALGCPSTTHSPERSVCPIAT